MARVLQLVTELVVGGASISMLDVAEDLATMHDVHIAHGPAEDPDNPVAARARSTLPTHELAHLNRRLSPLVDLAAGREIANLCRHLRPDVLHTHSSKAGVVGRLAAPRSVRVIVHTVHGWGHTPLDSRPRRALLIGAERLAARRTTALIAVSGDVRDEGLALRIGASQQYEVIGEPVEFEPSEPNWDRARAVARSCLGLSADTRVVGWVGRFSAQKDPETLAAVVAALLSARPRTQAVLIGDGPDRDLVEGILRERAVLDRCLLTGARPDVRALYAAFDVLVHTSRWEGHPRVIQEALAERVPVVTARVSGTRDIIVDPQLGVEVPVGDVGAFVAAALEIIDDPGRRAPLSAAALRPLADRDKTAVLRRTAALYERLLG